jgi:hypothetical protein
LDQIVLVALKCPNCGGKLEVTGQMSHFACGYCGANVKVLRQGGTVSLSLEDAIARVQIGTDRTAAELALRRLKEELAEAEAEKISIERSVSNGVADRQAAIARREEGTSDRNFTSMVFVVAWVLFALIASAFKVFKDSVGGAGFVAACAVALPVWLVLVNGRAAQVLRLKRQIEELKRKGNEDIAKANARMEDLRVRIAKNRSIVDG